jgi:hypothetical protein
MKIQDYIYLLKNPQNNDTSKVDNLEEVIKTFPYFQSARALFLKGLKDQDSFKYNQFLKTTAAYTTDRSVLFNFIISTEFNNKTEASSSEIILEEIEVIDAQVIKALHKKITSSQKVEIKEAKEAKEKLSSEILKIGKPLEFNIAESHSFGEWLQLEFVKPIVREAPKKKKTINFDLIDKFIANKPKIKPVKDKDSKPIAKEQPTTDYNSLMTETLAKVYLEQKKYESAIKAYRILSLKYPEKSSFFADRIKTIKLLDKK